MNIKLLDYGYKNPPKRAFYNDAGSDVYTNNDTEIVLKPGTTVKIPLGFGIVLPDGLMGIMSPRSGKSSQGLVSHIPPIDSGYTGELNVIVSNISLVEQVIEPQTRIAQLVITPVILADFIAEEKFFGKERGANGFGSTGDK